MKLRHFARALCALSFFAVAAASLAQTQDDGSVVGTPWTGDKPVRETVAQIMARQKHQRLGPQQEKPEPEGPDRSNLPQNPLSPYVSHWPPAAPSVSVLSAGGNKGGGNPYSMGLSWTAGNSSESTYVPPDTQGAVGPTQFLVAFNAKLKVYDKNGVLGSLNVTLDTFFNSVTVTHFIGDTRVRYDRLSQRWFVIAGDFGGAGVNNRILLATSDGPTITASTVWSFYYFQQNLTTPVGDDNRLADYPTLGVDANAVYIGCNMFNPPDGSHTNYWYNNSTVWVVRKSSITSGGPIVVSTFRDVSNGAVGPGLWTPNGVDNDDPAATVGYFIGTDVSTYGTLMIRRITNPGGTPTISGNVPLVVPSTYKGLPVEQPQPAGHDITLDCLDDRLFSAQIRKNFLTGQQTLWTAHNVRTNNAGIATVFGDRTATRWYQIASFDAAPSLVQSGTLYDAAGSNIRNYWMSTVTMNGQGHMMMGFSLAGTNDYAGVGYSGRLFGDALGTQQPPVLAWPSSTYYDPGNYTTGTHRWGDYSMSTVDPNDQMTIWTIQEFCDATNSWAVRVMQLRAPQPASIASVVPNSAGRGQTLNVVINGTSVNGSAFFDPGAGFANHMQAAFGAGITVNSVTYNSGTQATVNITISPTATPGTRDVNINNPDGQGSRLLGGFTITSAPITVSPTSFTTFRGVFQSGGLTDLFLSDDSYVAWKPGFVLSSAEAPVDVFVNATSPLASPTTLQFTLEGKSTVTNVGQTLSLFNYVTNAWEQVDFRGATTADQVVTVTVSSNASRFVNPSDLAMRARVAYKATGPVLSYPWTIRIDQTIWQITP